MTTSRSFDPPDQPSPWVVCLDLQRDPSAGQETPDLRRRIGICRVLLTQVRQAGWPLTHVLRRPSGPGECRLQPIEGLQPRPFEPVIFRPGLSAFSSDRFQDLVETARGDDVILMSVALGPACLATVLDAHDRGIRVTLVEDTLSANAIAAAPDGVGRRVLLGVAGQFVRPTTSTGLIERLLADGRPVAANEC